jgi:hypothetical protein
MLRLAFREQNKDPASLDRSGSQEWEVIYGSAFHCFGSGGVRDVFRGA